MKRFILRFRIHKSFIKSHGWDKIQQSDEDRIRQDYHSFAAVWNAFNNDPSLKIN